MIPPPTSATKPTTARRRSQLLAILAIFLVSILLRVPFLARPLQGQHDWLTIHSLLTISIWQQVGLSYAHNSLIMNYPNEADKYISYIEKGTVMDQRGNTYFVAFPPFAFLLGYAVIHLLHLPVDALWLRIINLALLLPASLCFFLVLERMFENLGAAIASRFAMLGVALFLFDRAVLMSLGLYFPVILVIPLWIMAVYFFFAARDGWLPRGAALAVFFFLTLLAGYSDWLGMIAAGVFFLWSLIGEKRSWVLAVLSGTAGCIAALLTVLQYASISGMSSYLHGLLFRFQDRSGISSSSQHGLTLFTFDTYREIRNRYLEQHHFLLLFILCLVFAHIVTGRRFDLLKGKPVPRGLLFVFGLPVLIDHVLLVNHTAIHDYAALKATPLLTILAMLLLANLYTAKPVSEERSAAEISSIFIRYTCVVAVVCLFSVKDYLSQRNALDPKDARLGAEIRNQSDAGQVIFLKQSKGRGYIPPNLIYFAGRNIKLVQGAGEAEAFLREYHRSRGILFDAGADGALVSRPQPINLSPETIPR